jgi:hypothetical protein
MLPNRLGKVKPQISPLRFAPVEMTIQWKEEIPRFQEKCESFVCNKFVVSTAAKRSGEICGFTRTAKKPLSPGIHCNEAQPTSSPALQQQPDGREGNGSVGTKLPMTAIVQQEVGAPVQPSVVQKPASHPRCQILGIRGFPIEGSHIPHHRRQPKFPRSAQYIRPARAEGGPNISHDFPGYILDDGSTRDQFLSNPSGACPQ